MKATIWTAEARGLLYQRLVALFGPYDTWEKVRLPGRSLDEQFNAFCDCFAKIVGAESSAAVQHQIAFAMPETNGGSTWSPALAQTAILNKAAALQAGFIRNMHLPEILAIGPRSKREDE